MVKTTYLTCEENGRGYAERIADAYRRTGATVTVEHG